MGPGEAMDLVNTMFPFRESCPLRWENGKKVGIHRSHRFKPEEAGVYIPCTTAGIVVVDIDEASPATEAVMHAAAAAGCNLVVQTPKGVHLYFSCSERWPTLQRNGVDVKCAQPQGDPKKGDLIMCPPSYLVKDGVKVEYKFFVHPGAAPLVPAPAYGI
eukprot:PhF_6_TR10080/c0_g5_i1/m.15672